MKRLKHMIDRVIIAVICIALLINGAGWFAEALKSSEKNGDVFYSEGYLEKYRLPILGHTSWGKIGDKWYNFRAGMPYERSYLYFSYDSKSRSIKKIDYALYLTEEQKKRLDVITPKLVLEDCRDNDRFVDVSEKRIGIFINTEKGILDKIAYIRFYYYMNGIMTREQYAMPISMYYFYYEEENAYWYTVMPPDREKRHNYPVIQFLVNAETWALEYFWVDFES